MGALLLACLACVEPLDEIFLGETPIIIVDARFTNIAEENYVRLSKSENNGRSSVIYRSISNATVKLVIDNATEVLLTETEDGLYSFPQDILCEVGKTYKIDILTPDGTQIYSVDENVTESSVPIKKSYAIYEKDQLTQGTVKYDGHEVYLDFEDPANQENYYMWDWTYYEKQYYCYTCTGQYYFRDERSGDAGECRDDNRARRGRVYDYSCEKDCWEIIRNNDVYIQNDEFSNGLEVKAKNIASIPLYSTNGALVDIKQHSINKKAYAFLKLVKSQGQDTGGLADTPPATLSGNLYSTNAQQPIAGYFMLSQASQDLFWLDRSDILQSVNILGLFNPSRRPSPEPSGLDTTRPPLAPCNNSSKRTSIRPTGWLSL